MTSGNGMGGCDCIRKHRGERRTVNSHYFGALAHPKYTCNTPANNFVQIQAGFTSDILVNSTVVFMS